MSVEVVFLCGPSFSGQSVVVDDDDSCQKSRRSYLNLLKNKVKDCQYRVVHFKLTASSGHLQCLWLREWQLAMHMELPSLPSFIYSAKKLENWFEKKEDPPSENEGFSRIEATDPVLVGDTPYKFEISALFIEWDGVIQCSSESQSAKDKLIDVINRWFNANSTGRVIVLKADEKRPCTEMNCECVEEMRQFIEGLVTQLSIPIYFVHILSHLWPFSKPPQPGIFAWLQRLHCIDLSHKATLYIYSSESHLKAGVAAGIKCIKAKKVFENPQVINAVYCGVVPQPPECVRKARLAWFGSSATFDIQKPQEPRPAACLPFYLHIFQSLHSRETSSVGCVTLAKAGRVHGICFKDFSSLERYNTLYKNNATPTELASSRTECFQTTSSIFSEQENVKVVEHEDKWKAEACTPPKSYDGKTMSEATSSASYFIKHLKPADVEKHAFSPGHFTRGKGCSHLIRNIKSTMEQDGALLSANCVGSQGQLYNVSVLLKENGIIRGDCSCPDLASKNGKCKHVVALLFACKKDENNTQQGKTRKFAAEGTHSQQPNKAKSLPSWVSSLAQDSQQNIDEERRKKTSFPAGRMNVNRLKRKHNVKSTLYCMSADELLQTAKQVMTEKQEFEKHCQVADIKRSLHKEEDCKRRKQSDSPTPDAVLSRRFFVRDESPLAPPTVESRLMSPQAVDPIPETVRTTMEEFLSENNGASSSITSASCSTQNTSSNKGISDKQKPGQHEEKQESKQRISVLDDFI